MHQADNFNKQRPELTDKDYALPTSFGSTKRDYNRPSYNDNENTWDNRKRRNDRDDYNCRYDKRSRNDNRNDGRDRRSFRYDRNSDRNSDRYDDRRCRDDKPHERDRSGDRRRSRDDRNRGGKEEGKSDVRISRFDKDDADTGNMGEKRSRFDNVRTDQPLKQDTSSTNADEKLAQQSEPSNPPIPAFAPRLPFTPGGNFNPRNMPPVPSQFPTHLQQMYNNRMPHRPRFDQNNRFPLSNRFQNDSNIPRPRYDAMRLPNTNRPRYDNQWNTQTKSRFQTSAPETKDLSSSRPQIPSRFPPPSLPQNIPQLPHDLFKQSIQTNLIVPPPSGMPLAFNPHFAVGSRVMIW